MADLTEAIRARLDDEHEDWCDRRDQAMAEDGRDCNCLMGTLTDALRDLLAACDTADDTWDLTARPGPRPGAPDPFTASEAWLPTAGIRNLIARALGVEREEQT